MEDMMLKKSGRLSLTRKHKINDSPKTPGRVVKTPDSFHTPPSAKSTDSSCSTPIYRRKRTCFAEESPSQEYEYSPISILSQEMPSHILDVDWDWKDKSDRTSSKNIQIIPKEYKSKRKLHVKNVKREKPVIDKTKGFYKFCQELSEVKDLLAFPREQGSISKKCDKKPEGTDSGVGCSKRMPERLLSLDLDQKSLKPQLKPIKTLISQKESPLSLLDDSDTDNLLAELSQKVEEDIQKNYKDTIVNKTSRKTINAIQEESNFDQDSIDEILLSLPLDENELQVTYGNDKRTSDYSSMSHNSKSSFSRTNSMPVSSPKGNWVSSTLTRPLIRHNSMPINDETSSTNSSNSANSAIFQDKPDASKRLCTKEEVERKRLEAKRRQQLSQLRKKQERNFLSNSNQIKSNFFPTYSLQKR